MHAAGPQRLGQGVPIYRFILLNRFGELILVGVADPELRFLDPMPGDGFAGLLGAERFELR